MTARAHPIIALAVVLFASTPANGHELSIYALPDGAVVRGRAYYDSTPAAGVRVTVLDEQRRTLGEVTTDDKGEFAFTPTIRRDHVFVAETEDGHRAEDTVHWESLPESIAPAAEAPRQERHGHDDTPQEHSDGRLSQIEPPISADLVRETINESVRAQILPLRQELKDYRGEVRLYGISAGVGFILGIFGVAALITARRRPSDRV